MLCGLSVQGSSLQHVAVDITAPDWAQAASLNEKRTGTLDRACIAKLGAEAVLCHASAVHKRRAWGHPRRATRWLLVISGGNVGMRRSRGELEGQALPRQHGEAMAGWWWGTGRAPLGPGQIRRCPRCCTWRRCWAKGWTATCLRPKLAGWRRAAHPSSAAASADPLRRSYGACAVPISNHQCWSP